MPREPGSQVQVPCSSLRKQACEGTGCRGVNHVGVIGGVEREPFAASASRAWGLVAQLEVLFHGQNPLCIQWYYDGEVLFSKLPSFL